MGQTISTIRSLLASRGLRPKHRLGQNFLHDPNKMVQIVEAAGVSPGDLVLEVGAGTGGLSERLLDVGARLVAVEVDRALEPILRERLGGYGDRVRLIIGDVLAGKHAVSPEVIEALCAGAQVGEQVGGRVGEGEAEHGDGRARFTLVANLPYQVASPLLVNLAIASGSWAGDGGEPAQMTGAVVMVQREVADRLTARAGGKSYGPLSVMVQAVYGVELLFTVSAKCFWPVPDVASAVVVMRRRESAATEDLARLSATVRVLFGQRRKQIGSILGRERDWPDGVRPDQRAGELSVEQLVSLGYCLRAKGARDS